MLAHPVLTGFCALVTLYFSLGIRYIANGEVGDVTTATNAPRRPESEVIRQGLLDSVR